MKKILTILTFAASTICFGQNTIKSIYIPDIAREFVQFTTTASAGTMPSASAFTVNGVNPTAVIKTNDTLVSLLCVSAFSEGQSVTVNYTAPGGGQIGGMASFTSRGVDNQITAGVIHHWTTSGHTSIFLDYLTDFNTTYSIDSGDIVELDFGDYLDFDVSYMTGVRFVAKYSATADSVRFKYFNIREKVINSGLFGHPAMPTQNVRIRSIYAGNFGIGCFATGYIWFENLYIYNVSQGVQVKTVSDLPFPPYNQSRLPYQNLTTKYITVHRSSEEAFYIGSDVAAPLIPIRWTGFGLVVDSAGRDAFQYRNGNGVWLKNLTATTIGEEHNLSHSHCFLWGTTTEGTGYVENLTGTDIWGNGALINGYGVITFKNVNLSSKENTVYVKNYDDHDEYNVKGLVLNFICASNVFECTTDPGGYSLDVRMDPVKTRIVVNINSSTTFDNPLYVETGNGVIVNYTSVCKSIGFIN